MSQRNKRKKRAKKSGKTTEAAKMIPFDPKLKAQIDAFNTAMMGARMALGVPDTWTINPQRTAFVPPPKMPEAPKKKSDKKE